MRCWNCNRKLPKDAKICVSCEAQVEDEPTVEEKEAVNFMLERMPPDVMSELRQLISESATAEEFVDRIFVGDCPKCGSQDTGNCESDPEVNELLVGRCYECGQLFCTECSQLLKLESPTCKCWDDEF